MEGTHLPERAFSVSAAIRKFEKMGESKEGTHTPDDALVVTAVPAVQKYEELGEIAEGTHVPEDTFLVAPATGVHKNEKLGENMEGASRMPDDSFLAAPAPGVQKYEKLGEKTKITRMLEDLFSVAAVPAVQRYEELEESVTKDELVEVCGMMHLLSDQVKANDNLQQTLVDVYHNFTKIHKCAVALLDSLYKKFPGNKKYVELKREIGFLITFCRCSLKSIFKADGITINETYVLLLSETEAQLVDLINSCTNQLTSSDDKFGSSQAGVQFASKRDMMQRIAHAWFFEISNSCNELIINYDLMLEFLDQLLENLDCLQHNKYMVTMKKRFVVLRNLLESLTKDNEYLDYLLTCIENVAIDVARYSFLDKMCDGRLGSWYYGIEQVESAICVRVLRAFVMQPGFALMSDELLTGFVDCIQENCVELLSDKAVNLNGDNEHLIKSVHKDLPFLTHLLIRYQQPGQTAEQKILQEIRVRFQVFTRDIGYSIYSFFDKPETGNTDTLQHDGLMYLQEEVWFLHEEIGQTVCRIVLQRAGRESPRTYQLGFLIVFLENLKEVIDRKLAPYLTWEYQENLVSLISYLQSITTDDESQEIGELDDCKMDKVSLVTKGLELDVDQINLDELFDYLISSVYVVAFKMTCYSLLRKYGKFHWWEVYCVTKQRIVPHMRVGILKALVLSSTTPLTDELLIAYVQCVQDNLIKLQQLEDFAPLKDQCKILHEGLLILVRLVISYRYEQEELSHVKVCFQDLVRSVGTAMISCFSDLMRVDEVKEQGVKFIDLVEKLNLIKVEVKEILPMMILNRIGHGSPKTNQLGSLGLLLENWKQLMDCEPDSIVTWKEQLQMIHENFVLFKSFIRDSSTRYGESGNLCSRIMEAGYVAEYLLNSLADGSCPPRCTSLWLSLFTEDVEQIKTAVMVANMKITNHNEVSDAIKDPGYVSSHTLLVPILTDVVVGFEVEMERIRKILHSRVKKCIVIPIIGMPGLGKTTLARKVYEDSKTGNYFDKCAWCCVSQEYNKKELYLTILGSITELSDLAMRKSEADLGVMVHKELIGRRYLIVLDDVWETDAFVDLKRFFPDDNNGSRIILTSRSKVIALEAQCQENLIEPAMLTDEQSWYLLERKVFDKGNCPLELRQIGMDIARRCRGLPLPVVLVGGLLAKSTQKLDFWEQVAGNLSSYLARDSKSQFMAALELSYKFLPECLKPLFLYIGVFPEDKEILADKLIWLWVAEGLVQKTKHSSLEIQAEIYLKDLIDRSLVMVARRRSDGRVKACHIHDLLRDMCLNKAKEEKFMQHVDGNSELPDPITYHRRLSMFLQCDDDHEPSSRHIVSLKDLQMFSISPPIYSIFFFLIKQSRALPQEALEAVFSSLKLLKVLYAETFDITSDTVYDGLITLIHLRYVSIRLHINYISSSISRLRSLETLIIKGLRGEITVPETIWEMLKLRHLHINSRARFSAPPENPFILENLETLSTPTIDLGEEEGLFKKVPNVKKLRCIFNEGVENDHRIDQFPNFEFLSKLESLKVFYYGGVRCTGEFKLPLTLKKLSISKFCLKWSEVSLFMELKNLEILKLRAGSVEDEFWDLEDEDVFTSLKLLKFENLNIQRWNASAENFPCLEEVVFERCKKLEEIPSNLGEFETLQKIEVLWCSNSAAEMANEIKKEQEDFGNETLKVHIYPPPQLD